MSEFVTDQQEIRPVYNSIEVNFMTEYLIFYELENVHQRLNQAHFGHRKISFNEDYIFLSLINEN